MQAAANAHPDLSPKKLDSICNRLTAVLDGISIFQHWMFAVQSARIAVDTLRSAGADVSLRVTDDLSHAYPREENNRILQWFAPGLALPA